jgi:hypothetical protein
MALANELTWRRSGNARRREATREIWQSPAFRGHNDDRTSAQAQRLLPARCQPVRAGAVAILNGAKNCLISGRKERGP